MSNVLEVVEVSPQTNEKVCPGPIADIDIGTDRQKISQTINTRRIRFSGQEMVTVATCPAYRNGKCVNDKEGRFCVYSHVTDNPKNLRTVAAGCYVSLV